MPSSSFDSNAIVRNRLRSAAQRRRAHGARGFRTGHRRRPGRCRGSRGPRLRLRSPGRQVSRVRGSGERTGARSAKPARADHQGRPLRGNGRWSGRGFVLPIRAQRRATAEPAATRFAQRPRPGPGHVRALCGRIRIVSAQPTGATRPRRRARGRPFPSVDRHSRRQEADLLPTAANVLLPGATADPVLRSGSVPLARQGRSRDREISAPSSSRS